MSQKYSGRDAERVPTDTLTFGLDQSLDTIFRLFASQRRRDILDCLKDSGEPMELADLAGEVAARENDEPPSELPEEELKRVHLSLYHTHVPKLNDADIVRYDREDETVTLVESVEQLNRYEELLPDES